MNPKKKVKEKLLQKKKFALSSIIFFLYIEVGVWNWRFCTEQKRNFEEKNVHDLRKKRKVLKFFFKIAFLKWRTCCEKEKVEKKRRKKWLKEVAWRKKKQSGRKKKKDFSQISFFVRKMRFREEIRKKKKRTLSKM